MKVVITGATGLIGGALSAFLRERGDEVVGFSRDAGVGLAVWDPARGEIDVAALRGAHAVVHLAGANIAAGRWTAARRREILESRVATTRLLLGGIARVPEAERPRVLVGASAVGFYGDTGEGEVDENAPAGAGFLAEVCRQWEAGSLRAQELGLRVLVLRTGVVLGARGGALARLLPFFRAGLGGPVGDGRQWMSWIALEDLCGAIEHVIATPELAGPVNAVVPEPVRNGEFTAALGRALRRPAFLRVPRLALKLAFGRMAEETLLAGSRVRPRRLLESGFAFRHASLEAALRAALGT